jgi:hypothetical protein
MPNMSSTIKASDDDASAPSCDGDEAASPVLVRQRKPTSKQNAVLAKLKTPRGVTVSKLMEITGWRPHTVRGFLSATVRKKLGLPLISEIGKDGERRYRIARGGEGAAA